ncbi:phage antirepressor KilAC domain-containing protein [Guyparkeria sp. GHLCS8-2]|uniref:phage antirepressor KilAC domain-containing protein n=1 Tax=Guyparkeria halopsychrophila TaxID=3139421 RepID=UPI0037CC97AE
MQTQRTTGPEYRSPYLPDHYTVDTAAAMLGIGRQELFRELRRFGLIHKGNNKPCAPYVEQGLMAVKSSSYRHPGTGEITYYQRPMITPAGVVWLADQGVGDAR